MKTRTILLVFTCLFISISSFAQDLSPKQTNSLNNFIATVASNNEKKTLKFLDKAYSKEQLEFLKGDKKQLVDDLFGGQQVGDTDNYINVKISEVTSIELQQVIKLKGENTYTVFFKIHKGDAEIISTLSMVLNGKKVAFIGGLG